MCLVVVVRSNNPVGLLGKASLHGGFVSASAVSSVGAGAIGALSSF